MHKMALMEPVVSGMYGNLMKADREQPVGGKAHVGDR
mgnify:CR=1 FL=1